MLVYEKEAKIAKKTWNIFEVKETKIAKKTWNIVEVMLFEYLLSYCISATSSCSKKN